MDDSRIIDIIDLGERGRVWIVPTAEDLARLAAQQFAQVAADAIAARDAFHVALSGGSTPRRMGEILASEPLRAGSFWGRTDLFWGDERWVPLSSDESNAGVALRSFLRQTAVPPERVRPYEVDRPTPDAAAAAYETTVREVVGDTPELPTFDLVFLGMGEDAHTASLFPRTPALTERERLVVANPVPQLDTVRLTFTAPLINAARRVLFLVAGAAKAAPLADVLRGPERPADLPAQLVRPSRGELIWLVDEPAAAQLKASS